MEQKLALSTFYFPQINLQQFVSGLEAVQAGETLISVWQAWQVGDTPELSHLQYCIEKLWERCQQRNYQIIHPQSEEYPAQYLAIESPPLCLMYIGSPVWLHHRCLAVVGSRDPHTLSVQWMEEHLTEFFRKHRVASVSGGARGVDMKCHRVSLLSRVPTVVHAPSGLDVLYPRELHKLEEDVLAGGGALVSRFLPDQLVRAHHFYLRNELIAQMADHLLIVEAKLKSGTGLTAQWALKNNVPIGVVPGHPQLPQFAGSLKLITEGAEIIRDAKDLQTHWARLSDQIVAPPNITLASHSAK